MLNKDQISITYDVLRRAGFIKTAWIYGPYAKNKEKPDSELDIMFDKLPGSRFGLIKLSSIVNELEEALGKKVNLIQRKAMTPREKRDADNNNVRIYDQALDAEMDQVNTILNKMVENNDIVSFQLFDNPLLYTFIIYILRGCRIKAENNGSAIFTDDERLVIIGFARLMSWMLLQRLHEIEELIGSLEAQVVIHRFIDTYTQMQEQNVSLQ